MATADQKLDAALDLMRRLPPQYTERNVSRLVDLAPDICEDLLSAIDQPLKVARDEIEGKDFLVCDYNRDGDSHRSPYSNTYFPPMEDGGLPSDRIRQLEVLANSAFNMYREMYYEGGISSVYLWELDTDSGFAGVFLIKKSVGAGTDSESSGCWDSINVMEVREKANGRSAHYKLTSTVMLWLQTGSDDVGSLNLGGTMTRQMESDHELLDQVSGHVKNIGSMIEELENKTRSHLNDIYFGRTKDIVNGLRSCVSLEDDQQRRRVHAKLIDNLTNM